MCGGHSPSHNLPRALITFAVRDRRLEEAGKVSLLWRFLSSSLCLTGWAHASSVLVLNRTHSAQVRRKSSHVSGLCVEVIWIESVAPLVKVLVGVYGLDSWGTDSDAHLATFRERSVPLNTLGRTFYCWELSGVKGAKTVIKLFKKR